MNSKFGDFSAFILVHTYEGKGYVDADMAIRNISVIAETAVEIQRTFHPDWFGVEVNQFQHLLAEDINRRAEKQGVIMPLYTIDNRVNKLVRIRRLTPLLSQGKLRFKGGSPGARLLVEQLRDFPNADHDDGPDALEMALRLASELVNDKFAPQTDITTVYFD